MNRNPTAIRTDRAPRRSVRTSLHKGLFRNLRAALLIMLGLSLIFGSSIASASPLKTIFAWYLIRVSDGELACTIDVIHSGDPTISEVVEACGRPLTIAWQKGEYTLSHADPTAAPTGVITSWLDTPASADALQTNRALTYLAGKLIAAGFVDTSACNGSALLPNGSANPCGLSAARPYVFVWQNRYDQAILDAAVAKGIPAYMFKNLLIQESQMWPQASRHVPPEYGLGQLTDLGADTLLRWDNATFMQVCKQTFTADASVCDQGYLGLDISEQAMLRGVIISMVRADCSTCSIGIDSDKAEKSLPIFAAALKANFNQIDQITVNLTGRHAQQMMEWQEIWKLTAANYHAGPGCVGNAMRAALKEEDSLHWKYVSKRFEPACQSAVGYVDYITTVNPGGALPSAEQIELARSKIFGYSLTATPTAISTPTQTPTPDFSATPTATLDLTVTPTPDFSVTPTATLDLTATPTPEDWTPTATLDVTATITPDYGTATPTLEVTPTVTLENTPTPTPNIDFTDELQLPHVTDQVVLKIDPENREAVQDTLQWLGINLAQDGSQIESLDTFVIEVPPEQLETVLTTLQNSGGVEFVEPNYLAGMAGLPNDADFSKQANLLAVQAPQTWDALPSMQEVLVAVVDTGVDVTHPDLYDSIWQNPGESGPDENGNDKRTNGIDDDGNGYVDDWRGWNMIAGNNNVSDNQGHGTHLAGIIGAQMNNAIGIAGIAPNARILPVKALDATGHGSYAQVAEGIVYATDMGARIINLGFGGEGSSELLQNAIDYALAHDVLVVAAGGNNGNATVYYPAGYPGVIAVSAVDNDLYWTPFSSSGDHISLAAPGMGIYSTTPGGFYNTYSGTSMSAAHVSGVAALLAGQPQFADVDVLRSALLGGALDLGDAGRDPYFGYGVVQAFDALAYAGPVLPTPTPWIVPTSTPGGIGGVFAMASEDLWATGQTASFAITDPGSSIDSAFNDQVASISGSFDTTRNWTFTPITDTGLSAVIQVYVDIRFKMTGWTDDSYCLQIYDITTNIWSSPQVSMANIQPPASLTTLSFDVTTALSTVAKVNGARVRLKGCNKLGADGLVDNVTISVDGVRLRVADSLPTPTPTPVSMPTPTLPARWMTATPVANEPHNNYFSAITDTCASCHRSHTAKGLDLRSDTGEEQVCFACHTSGGSGTNVQPAFTANTNTLTRFFSHGVSSTTDVHESGENIGASFGGADRHIECEDCHAPHSTARTDSSGSTTAPSIQQEMYNSGGVDPQWTITGAPTGFTFVNKADREFQVCFKCHSSYTTLAAYSPDGYAPDGLGGFEYIVNGLNKLDNSVGDQMPDSRDLATQFNPYQISFHPVAAIGRNRNMPAGSFVAGWSQDSIIYCTDCHANATPATGADGPHGSPLLHMLDGSSDYVTQSDGVSVDGSIQDAGELCFKCHQFNTYAAAVNPASTTRFVKGSENLHAFHAFGSCYTCHNSHGSEQDRLLNFDTAMVSILSGNSLTAWQWNSATNTGTCAIACHGTDHSVSTRFIYGP